MTVRGEHDGLLYGTERTFRSDPFHFLSVPLPIDSTPFFQNPWSLLPKIPPFLIHGPWRGLKNTTILRGFTVNHEYLFWY